MTPSASILIVDDELSIRTSCQRYLARVGYSVDVAANADEALQSCGKKPFQILVTDIAMPGALNGQDLVSRVKRDWPATDILVMTGYPSLQTAIPVLKDGAFDYLMKPFEPEHLKQIIDRCLERRRLREELSQERKLREELQAAYAELQHVSGIKEAFLARVNHELRIPLTPALLAVDILSNTSKDAQTLQLCELTRKRLHQLQALIDNLLLFVHLKKDAVSCRWPRLSLRKTWTRIVEAAAPLWRERKIHVVLHFPRDAVLVKGNPDQIEAAFRQLLENAILFNRPGGTVSIESFKDASRPFIGVSVSDTGIGIPKKETEKVFDSFYQVASYLTREVGGVGLGLALVKSIAEQHGGNVTVKSIPRRGSTFTLYVPAA